MAEGAGSPAFGPAEPTVHLNSRPPLKSSSRLILNASKRYYRFVSRCALQASSQGLMVERLCRARRPWPLRRVLTTPGSPYEIVKGEPVDSNLPGQDLARRRACVHAPRRVVPVTFPTPCGYPCRPIQVYRADAEALAGLRRAVMTLSGVPTGGSGHLPGCSNDTLQCALLPALPRDVAWLTSNEALGRQVTADSLFSWRC